MVEAVVPELGWPAGLGGELDAQALSPGPVFAFAIRALARHEWADETELDGTVATSQLG